MPEANSMTAQELRLLARQKDWAEYCKARVERQTQAIANLTAKQEAVKVALEDARAHLAAAEADQKAGMPEGWKRPAAEGVTIGVPAAKVETKGN